MKIFDLIVTGNIDAIKKLLNDADLDIESRDDYGTTLHYATKENQIELVKILIKEYGADINAQDKFNLTPLCLATLQNNLNLMQVLLEMKANPEIGPAGLTPLHYAVQQSNLDAVLLLSSYRASLNSSTNISGRTLLHSVAVSLKTQDANSPNWELIKWLVENGVNYKAVDYTGKTFRDILKIIDNGYCIQFDKLLSSLGIKNSRERDDSYQGKENFIPYIPKKFKPF